MTPSRERMAATIKLYYDACNSADAEKMVACFTPDAVHYFPKGAPQGTFVGARAIAAGWRAAVERLDSRWTIDELVIDEIASQAAIEWTHWKPNQRVHLRGTEICKFDPDGRISEIRAYYAAPAKDPPAVHELGDFDYRSRGYPLVAPAVDR